MPWASPRVCQCGNVVAYGAQCPCQRRRKAVADKNRPTARERGYDSRWDKERKAFLATNSNCKRCGAVATVVDHIRPHRGDTRLFWDRSNWQALCVSCHSRYKQALERREAQR